MAANPPPNSYDLHCRRQWLLFLLFLASNTATPASHCGLAVSFSPRTWLRRPCCDLDLDSWHCNRLLPMPNGSESGSLEAGPPSYSLQSIYINIYLRRFEFRFSLWTHLSSLNWFYFGRGLGKLGSNVIDRKLGASARVAQYFRDD